MAQLTGQNIRPAATPPVAVYTQEMFATARKVAVLEWDGPGYVDRSKFKDRAEYIQLRMPQLMPPLKAH